MGQQITHSKQDTRFTSDIQNRIQFDEHDNNGMILGDNYIPIELITHMMFYYTDAKTLLNCQRVCKRWNMLITDHVWRKKATITTGHKFNPDDPLSWKDYYFIYAKNLFGKNLLKNHSGGESMNKHWEIMRQGGDLWRVECPPKGTPLLPIEPGFANTQHCFVTSFGYCIKSQVIDLIEEGFSEFILDNMKPLIEISEWYSCRFDCPAKYLLEVQLLDKHDKKLRSFDFKDILENERQNVWYKVQHVFKDYGVGLRKIRFTHGGKDRSFWAGHYGSKMARACVKAKIPDSNIS